MQRYKTIAKFNDRVETTENQALPKNNPFSEPSPPKTNSSQNQPLREITPQPISLLPKSAPEGQIIPLRVIKTPQLIKCCRY